MSALLRLLVQDDLSLPKNRNSFKGDYAKFLKSIFDKYLGIINSTTIPNLKSYNTDIQYLCKCIEKSVKQYLLGSPSSAYINLDRGIKRILPHLEKLITTNYDWSNHDSFYRIRVFDDNKSHKKEEFFHIPFELRQKVLPQRYSIIGLPCLYLGSSLYICWEELGRPSVQNVHLCKLRITDTSTIKLLNFGYRPIDVAQFIESQQTSVSKTSAVKIAISYLVCWPLLAAASIDVKYQSEPFKIEYIIPQLLLEWICKNKKIDGICYFSNKIENLNNSINLCLNYVFPAKDNKNNGLCSFLKNNFLISDPISLSVFFAVKPQVIAAQAPSGHISLIGNQPVIYRFSDLGSLEVYMENVAMFTLT